MIIFALGLYQNPLQKVLAQRGGGTGTTFKSEGIFIFMTYAEKLKDPRWQKKRLEVMQRDEFMCKYCYDNTTTLHVHHKYYVYGNDPWDYDSKHLITLCADCHQNEELQIKEYSKLLIETLRKSEFVADDWRRLATGINYMNCRFPPEVTASLVEHLLIDVRLQEIVFNIITDKNYKDGNI